GRERMQTFTTIESVLDAGFELTDPEYLAASLYFGQSPKPNTLMIGRWISTATAGFNRGGSFTSAEQTALIATLAAISDGAIKFTVDGVLKSYTAIDFTGITTLAGAAAILDTAVTADMDCEFNGSAFVFTSKTTGDSSEVSYSTAGASGTGLGPILQMIEDGGAYLVSGYAAETPVENAAVLM